MRREDWPQRLERFIDARRRLPFCWGVNDCALFAADWVREATGIDLAAPFRGRYATATGSARALRRYGAADLEATVTAALGKPIDAKQARRGDVVAVDTDSGMAVGICVGAKIAAMTHQGVAFVPRAEASAGWRV